MIIEKQEKYIEKTEEAKEKTALLVSVYNNQRNHELCIEHLDELELLCETYGVQVLDKVPCYIRKYEASTYVTKGKLEELIDKAKELNVDIIVFDDEISPAQQRNLDKLFSGTVMDRTEVILGVFAQRAQTKEAKLQIELAQAKYQAPRLKRMWTHLSRQAGTAGGGGAGAYLKGDGEKQIEIDKRLIRKRINKLTQDLNEVRAHRKTQRSQRQRTGIPVFALVGYTNAGKSTLLNSLTDAGVFTEDKLFATLDTTTRKFSLKNNQEILLIDTVGFIRKLPHLVVEAFKGTLEEALEADILIHVVDISHPMALEQAETTTEVLKELGAENKPVITVLNKVDAVEDLPEINEMRLKYPKTVRVSALKREGFEELENMMIEEVKKQRIRMKLVIPQSEYHLVNKVLQQGVIINQEYEGNDIILNVEIPAILANTLEKYSV
ncbi:MAG: GTPase HflX [Chlamydiota bacterium]|nr:GTPase HflX [Chlamydiota bacterium]